MPSPQPTSQRSADRPTAKQLRYLRRLAQTAGQTFSYPRTKRHASAEIRRLLGVIADKPLEHVIERRIEPERLRDEARRTQSAAAVRDDEVEGYGAHARWTHRRDRSAS
ncbi:hypothetical protein C8N24_2835 [Solirubrobacter pauli]|uniref:Uncharacterized protein n=1 Tax=Solirubrobacter pauli TaxID=166793 RepID=A0A660LD38_9ACTN|nr:hypothetical protein [Solirubrobacter pauli]RKQ92978.1 hypothetical protein C8N24_2835 [Solirubrobacter pauli]